MFNVKYDKKKGDIMKLRIVRENKLILAESPIAIFQYERDINFFSVIFQYLDKYYQFGHVVSIPAGESYEWFLREESDREQIEITASWKQVGVSDKLENLCDCSITKEESYACSI